MKHMRRFCVKNGTFEFYLVITTTLMRRLNWTYRYLFLLIMPFFGLTTLLAQTGPGGVGNSTTVFGWWDASQESYSNGSVVPVFSNQLGSIDFTQTINANQPTYVSSGINGRPSLDFDGASDFMGITSGGALSGLQTRSYVNVYDPDGGGASTQILLDSKFDSEDGDFRLVELVGFGYTRHILKRDDGSSVVKQLPTSSATTKMTTSVLDIGSSVFENRFNGTQFSSSSFTGSINTNNFASISLGKIGGFAQNYFSGLLAESIIFQFALNQAQINIVENYLAAKYGITIPNDLYAFQATHGNEVAGIGRESATDLNNDAQGSGIVRINNPSSLSDGDYLLFGHDGAALSETGSSAVAGIQNEVARSWVADLNTGNVGTVDISFNIGSVPFSLGTDPAGYRLLLDDDGVFGPGTTVSAIGPSGSTTITFSGVDLYSDGPYFKLAHTGAELCTAFSPGDWDNGVIWSCPGFPDSTNNAELDPGVAVTVTGAESVNDLTLQASSNLTLNPGTSLIIKGELLLENGATITADPSSTIFFRGIAGGQTLTNNTGSPITFGNLVINNADGVDLNDTEYSIAGGLSLINGDLNVFGNLTFTSDIGSHGHLRVNNGFGINAASYTTERFMSGRAANWNGIATLAIPTTIADLDDEIFISGVAGADGFAQNSTGGGFISIWHFDQATQQYVAVGNVNDAMPLGRGYEAWLGDNLSAWNAKAWNFNGGSLNYQTEDLNLVGGWNLVGNPLPGFLDFEQIAADHPQINGGEYWHYDANNGNYGTISGAGSFVPPGQGFWLFCTSGFTLSIDPALYLRDDLNNSNLFKLKTDEDESFKVAVKNKGEGTVFGSAIYLRKDPQAYSGVDAMDIPPLKVPDTRAIKMWMDFNGQERMVNYVNTDEEHIELPLYIESGLPGEFEMNFKGLEYFEDYQCFNLLNEETGEQIEIYPEASYSFTINENLDPLNMKILISKKDYADCMAPTSFSDNEVRVFSSDKMIHTDFYLDKTVDANITVMNSLGQVIRIEQATVSYNRNSIDMSTAQAGIYFVNVQINGQTKTEKVILQ